MIRFSHSRVELFERCQLAYKCKYLDKIEVIPNFDANNPLVIGSTLHLGIECKDYRKYYEDYFPILTNKHIDELIKLDKQIPRVNNKLSMFKCEYEYKLESDDFLGYIDLVIHNKDGSVNLYDFKYSNRVENYLNSRQLHIYKYYYEKLTDKKVKKIGYIFVPKTMIRQKNKEQLFNFRKRIIKTLEQPFVEHVDYDETKVNEYFNLIEKIKKHKFTDDFCDNKFCEYCRNLEKGANYMFKLPENKKRERVIDTKPDLWVYADSYVGKSTFVDQFDDLLFINTDGNTDNTTSTVIPIKDEKTQEGRILKTKYGWETFLEVIDALETQENTFKTVAIDLVEDLRELCRLYIFNKYDWEHESDGNFGKGWTMVSNEFNNAIKRLKRLGYQVVYISKEKREEIKLKNGNSRTTFLPNLDDKTANILAGTVDLTVRAYVDEEGKRKLQLKKTNNVFGGGRFNFKRDVINLDMNEFKEALIEAQEGVKLVEDNTVEDLTDMVNPFTEDEPAATELTEEQPKRRRRRKGDE